MRWLITGGCGHIGTRLIESLLQDGGHSVRVIDNCSTGSQQQLSTVAPLKITESSDISLLPTDTFDHIELVIGDVVDGPLAFKAASCADIIVHLASPRDEGPWECDTAIDCAVNVFGTLNMLEAARANGVNRFVFASYSGITGNRDEVERVATPFRAGKLSGENYCSAYFETYGVETVSLRFGNVFGPGAGAKCGILDAIISDAIHGNGAGSYPETRHDCLFIDDAIEAILLAASVPGIGGHAFEIHGYSGFTISELQNRTRQLLGNIERNEPAVIDDRSVYDMRRHGFVDRETRELLGWRQTTDLDDAIRATASWMREEISRISLNYG